MEGTRAGELLGSVTYKVPLLLHCISCCSNGQFTDKRPQVESALDLQTLIYHLKEPASMMSAN